MKPSKTTDQSPKSNLIQNELSIFGESQADQQNSKASILPTASKVKASIICALVSW